MLGVSARQYAACFSFNVGSPKYGALAAFSRSGCVLCMPASFLVCVHINDDDRGLGFDAEHLLESPGALRKAISCTHLDNGPEKNTSAVLQSHTLKSFFPSFRYSMLLC